MNTLLNLKRVKIEIVLTLDDSINVLEISIIIKSKQIPLRIHYLPTISKFIDEDEITKIVVKYINA